MRKVEKVRTTRSRSAFVSRFLFPLLVSFMTVLGAMAQEAVVKGKVVSSDGSSVIGANVTIKGTTKGTLTDANGEFSIKVDGPSDMLVFAFMGLETQEIEAGSQTNINVSLKESVKQLKEVQVTAMGIKKETRTIGYTSQEIRIDDLSKAKDVNPINSLTGKVAGLSVGQSSEFLGTPQMILRGSSELLYVVDGVPINSDSWNINGDDVESYTILKGPNAAALYGFRGQNGAILITTKKGTGDGVSVDFNSSNLIHTKSFLTIPVRQSEYGYGDNYQYFFGNDRLNADGAPYQRPNVWGPRMEGQLIPQWDSPVVNGVRQGTPWVTKGKDNFVNFMETGYLTSNNLALSASSDKYNIRLSVSDNYQKAMNPNTGLNILNLNIYSGYQLTKKLRVDGNMNYNSQNSPNVPDVAYGPNSYTYMIQEYGSAHYDIRDMKDYWQEGYEGVQQKYAEYGRCNNPYFIANEWLRGHYKTDIYGYVKASYEITPELTASARTQVSNYNVLRNEKLPISAIAYGSSNSLRLGQYREDRRNFNQFKTDAMLLYNKNITSTIYLSALAGAEMSQLTYNSSWITTGYLNVPGVYSFGNSLNATTPYSWASGMNTQSGFYSADLSFDKYATLSHTNRVDKISTLPEGKNSYFYPSVSLSSVVTDYVKLPEVISHLKIRTSFADVKGALTKNTVGPAWFELERSNPIGYGTGYMSPYGGPTYANQTNFNSASTVNNTSSVTLSNTLSNPDLKPYTVKSYEAGFDIKFLKNRLGFDVTYFTTINGPQIYQWDIAPSTGFTSKMVNGVTSQKTGWEITSSINPVKTSSGFSWDIMANWSTHKETLKELYGGAEEILLNDHYYKVGDRLDAYYGYKFYHDNNGNIIHDVKGMPLLPQKGTLNKKFLGYLNNDFAWGVSNTFSYKFASLSFSFDGRVGGVIHDQVYSDMMQSGAAIDLVQGDYGKARLAEWETLKTTGVTSSGAYTGPGVALAANSVAPTFDKNGDIDNLDKLTLVENATAVQLKTYVNTIQGFPFQEPYMVSRTYAKLRDISLTLQIPSSLLGKKYIKKASISFVGRNLLYITKTRKDFDLDQYATGFDFARIGQNTATNNSGSFATETGAKAMSQGANAQMQTPTSRQFGVNLNFTF